MEVTKNVVIGGLEPYDAVATYPIRLRKCGDDYHVRCSFERSETLFGIRSTPTFSAPSHVGFYSVYVETKNLNLGRYFEIRWNDVSNSPEILKIDASVTSSESLRNPSNFKSYAFNDTFYQCHCPSSSELQDNHELSGDVDSYYDVPYMFNGDTLIDSGFFDSSTTDSSPQRLNIRSTLFTTSGEECYISTVRCEVTVYEDLQTPVGPTIYGRLFEYREEFPNEMLTFCMIDGLCYEANFTSPFEDTHACFPSVDPYRWMKDPLLERILHRPCTYYSQCHSKNNRYTCVNGMCECDSTVWIEDNGLCISPAGMSCETPTCGPITNTTCKNDVCACMDGHVLSDGVCVTVLDQMCTTNGDCPTGMVCINATCSCPEGQSIRSAVDTTCTPVLGSDCSSFEETCGLVNNATCSDQSKCACKPGFFASSPDSCMPVVNHAPCAANSDCLALAENTECTTAMCICASGFIENNGKCISEGSTPDFCDEEVRDIPDLYRRDPGYKTAKREVPIQDHKLPEAWYNLGPYLPSVDSGNIAKGDCGTFYPIYLTDTLRLSHDGGNSTESTVYINGTHVKGIGPYNRVSLYQADLTEEEIIDEFGQTTAGFDIQCSAQMSESLFGMRSTPTFSEKIYVGFFSWVVNASENGAFAVAWQSQSPIGCVSEEYAGDTIATEYSLDDGTGPYTFDFNDNLFTSSGEECHLDHSTDLGFCVIDVPGDFCVPGENHCDSVTGGAYCDDVTKVCTCFETHTGVATECAAISLGDTCVDDDGCSLVSNAGCYDQETGTNSLCECKFGYAENENRQCVSTGVITKPDPYNSQQWCYQDDDQCSASLWYTVCDDWYWQCVTRSCNASSEDGDASCMSKLLYCNAESGFCEPHLCSATDQRECKLDNSECDVDKGYCGCVDGYSIWNGDCSPDVDQPCSSTTQCGKDSNTTCSDGQCECSAGFVLRDGACITVFLAGCNEDYDCSAMEGLECSSYAYYDDQFFGWNDPEYSGVCVCRPGYAPYARACKQVLGSQCDELKACGNASHWSYSYHYYSWGHYYAQYFKHYHSAFYCDVFDTCQCSRGYIKNADGTDCIAHLGSYCTSDEVCSVVDHAHCNLEVEACTCINGFIEDHENDLCTPDPDCAEDIPDLPDMRRRSSQYELSYNEPMINDDLLNAEWYNIDSVPSLNDGESIETYFQIGGGSGITEQFPRFLPVPSAGLLIEGVSETPIGCLDPYDLAFTCERPIALLPLDMRCGMDTRYLLLQVPVGDSLLEPNLSPTPYAYEEVLYDCGCPTSGDLIDTEILV
ncbi:hypothetical protein MAR_013337 [Mya arenaria]|uniref:EGF-like domain-containing protein n=1 Tax=Mya arenaria TaxID=6604 RepID=A0ABY7FZJ7_MYAAR|nr:hypothetical protein MAR_013337 [Mya arenaria]